MTKPKSKRKYELESPKGLELPLTPPPRHDKMSGLYVQPSWPNDTARPAGNDHERYPSRMGDRLHFRDGRKAAA